MTTTDTVNAPPGTFPTTDRVQAFDSNLILHGFPTTINGAGLELQATGATPHTITVGGTIGLNGISVAADAAHPVNAGAAFLIVGNGGTVNYNVVGTISADATAGGNALEITNTGTGIISLSHSGAVSSASGDGVRAVTSGTGSVTVVLTGGVTAATGTGVVIGGSGSNSLTNDTAQTITGMTGVSTLSGATTITNRGTIEGTGGTAVQFGGVGNVLIMDGPSAALTGNAVGSGTDVLRFAGATGSTFDMGQIDTGFIEIQKTDASTWTMTGTNTSTAPVLIVGGVLQAGAGAVFNPSARVTADATLDLNGTNQTIGSLAGGAAGVVTNGAAATVSVLTAGGDNTSTTFSGVIQDGAGTVGLTKAGTGTLTLSGANTYTGATTISGGTLGLIGGGSIASSSEVNLAAAGAGFDISGTAAGATITTLSGVAGSTVALGAQTLTTISNGSTAYAGVIGGTGGLTKAGAGTLNLSAVNTYTGMTTITSGTLGLIGGGSIASSSEVNLAAAGAGFDISGTAAGATITTLGGVA
ncbi:MAG: autotransporter-associated beta strand repeat-containing protein, partial [Rhizobiales bacterium]|nr:autotransporter-associated beta strand repeat-containing protein [Hyphomicrobiales bacterium]